MIPTTAFIALQSNKVQTYASQKILEFLSENLNSEFSVDKIEITFFNKVSINRLYIEDQAGDTLLFANKLTASISQLSIKQKSVTLQKVRFENAFLNLYQDSSGILNLKFLLKKNKNKKEASSPWDINFKNVEMTGSRFNYATFTKSKKESGINFSDLKIYDIDLVAKRFKPEGDTINFILKSLSCKEQTGFIVDHFSSKTSICRNHFIFEDAAIHTPYSSIKGNRINFYFSDYTDFQISNLYTNVQLDISIDESRVNFSDLSYFAEVFTGSSQNFLFSGDVKGELNNLSGKKLDIRFGDYSAITGEIELDGLPKIKETFIYAKFNSVETNFDDVAQLDLPGKKFSVPVIFKKMGLITYSGRFTGFINDFVAYGSIHSDLGLIKTDILIKPDVKNTFTFSGNLVTENYNLGSLLENTENIGNLSMNVTAKGSSTGKTLSANISGMVNLLEVKQYVYKNISLSGILQDKKYDGKVTIKDPNLDLDFHGLIDFSDTLAKYNFFASVAKANLYALNLTKSDPYQTISFDVKANAMGNKLNDLKGEVNLINSLFTKKDKQIQIYDINVIATDTFGIKNISLTSDFMDLELRGNFEMDKAGSSLRKFVYTYLPAYIDSGKIGSVTEFENRFVFSASLKNIKPVFDYFIPGYSIGENTRIKAQFEPDSNSLRFFMSSPVIEIKNAAWNNLYIDIESNDSVLNFSSGSESLMLNNKFYFDNFTVKSIVQSGTSDVHLRWNNWDSSLYMGSLKALVSFEDSEIQGKPSINVHLLPTRVVTYDSVWNIHECNIKILNKDIEFDNVQVNHGNQYLKISGKISENPEDILTSEFHNFNLGQINRLINSSGFNFEGILNGNTLVSNIYSNPYFFSELKVDSLIVNEEKLGDMYLNTKWNNEEKSISLNAFAKRGNLKTINIEGTYFPARQGQLNFDFELNKLRLDVFEPYLKTLASNLKGFATGKLKLLGNLKKPLFNGEILLQKTTFKVNYLKTQYNFTHKVKVTDNNIYLNDLVVTDEYGKQAIVNGSVTNNYFKNFRFNLSINADNFQFLNTQLYDNSQFYGTAFATGLVQISGSPKNITMNIAARTERNTRIFIPLSSQEEILEYNFISFDLPDEEKTNEEDSNDKYKVNLNGIQMNFDLEITPEAEVQMIFDPTVGDILKGRGTGNIKMQISTLGKFSMFGKYVVEEGDYRFTMMNFINRTFEIHPGGEITWNGSPLDAEINLKAIYETRTSINDLFGTTEATNTTVHCIIQMTDKLMSPTIKLDVQLPNAEEETKAKIANVLSSNEEINKQFLWLLVTGKFALDNPNNPSETSSPYSDAATGNASEFLSNQLSHWLSQINNNVNVSVNYRNDNKLKQSDIEMALSTQIFNDKLTIYGNVDIPTNNATAAASSGFVGDIDLDYKLTKNGKIRVKVFRHYNEDMYDLSPSTNGVGFVFKEEFNTLGELWKRYWNSVFKKEEEEKETVKNGG